MRELQDVKGVTNKASGDNSKGYGNSQAESR